MTADTSKQSLRDRIAACIGPETYNRLIEAVPNTREKQRLRFWQEQLFRRVDTASGVNITTLDEYLDLFADARPLRIERKPLTKEQFLAGPIRIWYSEWRHEIQPEWFKTCWKSMPAFRDDLTAELTHDVSKMGSLGPSSDLVAVLRSVLDVEQIVRLYVTIRDESGRREEEWRDEFIAHFPAAKDELPAVELSDTEIDQWLSEADDE